MSSPAEAARTLDAAWRRPVPADELPIDLYLDTADLKTLAELGKDERVKGFTTNSLLMRKAGVKDYREFALRALDIADGRPISFAVLSDDLADLEQQARTIASWGSGIFVKVPVITSRGEPTHPVLRCLLADGIAVNVTAVMTLEQVTSTVTAAGGCGGTAIVSVFAGRVADTGRDPVPLMKAAGELVATVPGWRLLWGSTRESYNVFQAADSGCHIITLTSDVWAKLPAVGRDLSQVSRETVAAFGDAAGDYVVR
jgi:transaldolase